MKDTLNLLQTPYDKLKMVKSCSICLLDFTDGDFVVPLKCNDEHTFHKACVDKWGEQNYTCPVCREPIITGHGNISAYKELAQINSARILEDDLAEASLPHMKTNNYEELSNCEIKTTI